MTDARPAMMTARPDFTVSRLATDMKTVEAPSRLATAIPRRTALPVIATAMPIVATGGAGERAAAIFTRAAEEIVVEIFGIGEIMS